MKRKRSHEDFRLPAVCTGELNFLQLPQFERCWKRMKLNFDDDLDALKTAIAKSPLLTPVVPGTGGLRKLRFRSRIGQKGKSGSIRVCYAYFLRRSLVVLIVAYEKSHKSDLSAAERNEIKQLLAEIDRQLGE